jgi:hypothetical protein
MTTLSSFFKTDLVDDHVADDVNTLIAAVLAAEFRNVETISATKTLTDGDCQMQLLTASGANRDVKLPPEAVTNHVHIIYNNGASNNLVVKDDSAATTFATLEPGEWCLALPIGGSVWKVIDSNAVGITLASIAETSTGTEASKAVTPDGLAGSVYGTRYIALTVADSNTTPSTGDGQAHVVIPSAFNGYDVVSVLGAVTTVSSSGTPTFALRRLRSGSAVDVLSTNVTIDANEYTSGTAATPPVINTSNDDLQTGDILLCDLDTVGTGAKGHQLLVGVRLP